MTLPTKILIYVPFLIIGCGEVINVQNRAPSIAEVDVCAEGGDIFWNVRLADPEGDPTDIAIILDVSKEDEEITATSRQATMAPGPQGVGLVGLTTDDETRTHRIQWAVCDSSSAKCALTAQIIDLGGSEACACLNGAFTANQTPPLTIRLMDRQDSRSDLAFPEGLPVANSCR